MNRSFHNNQFYARTTFLRTNSRVAHSLDQKGEHPFPRKLGYFDVNKDHATSDFDNGKGVVSGFFLEKVIATFKEQPVESVDDK